MSIAPIFRLFPKSSLVTPQGDFLIDHIFKTRKAAERARYVYFLIHNGTAVFTRRIEGQKAKYAIVGD